jgi:cell shape-determining protein MreC
METQLESLIEATYRAYKKDETLSAKKKVNLAIKEINRKLYEVEQLVNQNTKLKTEMGVDQGQYWESTKMRFSKISERMLKISRKIKELGA